MGSRLVPAAVDAELSLDEVSGPFTSSFVLTLQPESMTKTIARQRSIAVSFFICSTSK